MFSGSTTSKINCDSFQKGQKGGGRGNARLKPAEYKSLESNCQKATAQLPSGSRKEIKNLSSIRLKQTSQRPPWAMLILR